MNSDRFNGFFNKRLVQHLIFWCAYLFLAFLRLADRDFVGNNYTLSVALIKEALLLCTLMAGVYTNLYVFIPRFFDNDKYRKYIFSNIVFVSCISLLVIQLSNLILSGDYYRHSVYQRFIWISLHSAMFITITSLLHFTKKWIRHKDISLNIKELEREKLYSELDSLKAQINPHFLFNTLNNIYSLSLIKSDEAPNVILKLSDLMRYIIYDCKDNEVILKDEINFIRNYINLERLRLQEHIDIKLSVNIENEDKKIAPLLFIPLLENAFKHSDRDSSKSLISISVEESSEKGVRLIIENTKDEELTVKDEKYSGLGISNVRKRLELIYGEKYNLIIKDKGNFFIVLLELYI